jgi:hypothetical protein
MSITEWELTADVAGWINEIIAKDRTLPFSRVKCEQRSEGALKHADLTLRDSLGRSVVSGAIKLPCHEGGSSPFIAAVVNDARVKALKASSKYFFTWNVNEFVLWETTSARAIWKDQNYKSWEVTRAWKESDLDDPAVMDAVRKWLPIFLDDLAKILQGLASIEKKSIDEKFIDSLKSVLRIPILATLNELDLHRKEAGDKSEQDLWMPTDHGWIICEDPKADSNNLEQTARFACCGLLHKLVFHESLLSRHEQIDKISVPEHIDTGEGLRRHVEGYFAEAIRITGDYETVFGKDLTAVGNRIPFYSDAAVPYWRDLIGQIHEFDFSELDRELIGNILERFIRPEERAEFDQLFESPGQIEDLAKEEPVKEDFAIDDPAKDSEALAQNIKPKRPPRPKPEEIAAEVFEEIKSTYPEMLRQYGPDFLDMQKPFDTFELPIDGLPERYQDLFKQQGTIFKKGKKRVAFIETKHPVQDDLVIEIAKSGIRGLVHLPVEAEECRRVLDLFSGSLEKRRQVIRELIENRTANEKVRDKVYKVVMQFILDQGNLGNLPTII